MPRVLEYVHNVAQQHRRTVIIRYIYELVRAVEVLLLRNGKRQGPTFIRGPFHLVDIPVRTKQGRVHDADIRPDAFDFLDVPQGEGVVVAVGDQISVRAHGIQIVVRHFNGGGTVRPVVVIPVFRGHNAGNEKARSRNGARNGRRVLRRAGNPVVKRRHGESYPYREHIERAGIGIVPFTDLIGRLVEVQDNRDSRHKEHQEHNPAAPLVPFKLPYKADDTKQQRKEEIVILTLVLRQCRGSVALVSEAELVQEADTAFPVSVENIPGGRAVDIVLASDEIPHKVAPVHPVELIVEEVGHIGSESGLSVLGAPDLGPLALGIAEVEVYVALVSIAPHTGEEHLPFALVLRVCRGVRVDIFPVERGPVFSQFKVVGSIEVLAVDKGRTAVLFAAEVADKRVGVVRLILVCRGLYAGADNHYREQREAYHKGSHAEKDRVPEHPFLFQRNEQAPEAQREQRDHKEQRSAVVRESEAVDEDPVEECGKFRKVWDKQEYKHSLDDHAYHKDSDKLPESDFPVLVLPIVVHKHKRRNGQEVQEVDTYREAHQKRYQYYPAVRVGLVRLLIPLAHRPENESREQRGHSVNLAFNRREPEGVGEAVRKGAYRSGSEYRDTLTSRASFNNPLGEKDYCQIEEEYGKG